MNQTLPPAILKFGGTSVQDSPAMRRVAAIVKSSDPTVVVTSALAGVTNSLLSICDCVARDDRPPAFGLLEQLAARHAGMLDDLRQAASDKDAETLADQLRKFLHELRSVVESAAPEDAHSPAFRDRIVAHGELLSSVLLTLALKGAGMRSEWFDVRRVMITDGVHEHAQPDTAALDRAATDHLRPLVEAGVVPVTQGFIGVGPDGATTTLGRGGSDYTAALLGAALGVDRIEIWTDVSGVMTADPRIVPEAKKIRRLSFAEAAELAYFGAKVLHPATLLPAVRSGIPVVVRNTMRPEDEGTTITQEADREEKTLATSIACKRGITVINITSARMLMAHGFLRRVFAIFDDFQTPVDLVSTSEVSVSMTIDDVRRLGDITQWLQEIGRVEVFRECAIVCVVSTHMRETPGMAARIFEAVEPANVRMISQGASELNLSFVVDEKELDGVVERLHAALFGT